MNYYQQERGVAEQLFKLALIAYLVYVCYQIILFITGGSWVDSTILTALVLANVSMSFWVVIQLGSMKGELGDMRGEFYKGLADVKAEVSKLAERIARVEAKIRL